MSSSISDGFKSLKNVFSKAVEIPKNAFLKSVEKTSENLRNFNAALFNFEAASFTQQAACLLRIGAGVIMTGSGVITMDPVLSMSGPFVAVSGFDKLSQYGQRHLAQNDEKECGSCTSEIRPAKCSSVLHMPGTYMAA